MEILFVAGFGPVSRDVEASRSFWAGGLGIEFEAEGDYLHTGALAGSRTFAAWPLTHAAQTCWGTPDWPADVPAPQAWVEFDVTDVAGAAAELEAGGHRLVHGPKTEPWGQTLARLLSPEGLLVGVAHTPHLRQDQEPG